MEDAEAGERRRRVGVEVNGGADAAVTQGSVFTACSSLTVMIMFWLSVTAATVYLAMLAGGSGSSPVALSGFQRTSRSLRRGGGTELRS